MIDEKYPCDDCPHTDICTVGKHDFVVPCVDG